MNIVIIGPAHPYRGGIAALNDRLAIELEKQGHRVSIVSFRLQYPKFLFPGKTQFTDSPKPEELKVVRWINSINPINWIVTGLNVRKLKPDLIIVRYWLPFMGPSTGTICRLARTPKNRVIAITDNILPHEKRVGDQLFTRYFVGSADGFIAMSGSVYEELDQFITKKPKLLSPHPVYDHYGALLTREKAIKNLGLDPAFRYVLFFGFIRDYKGLDLLLEAFALMEPEKNKVKLLVAGEFYSNEQKYLDLIDALKLKEHVLLRTQYIDDSQVNNYFCAADLVAQPYKSATQSGVTQVAYHFHKPMLVTNVGGLSEIVDHEQGGYVVAPDSTEIAKALSDFFSKKRMDEMVKHVEFAKERFSWSYFCKSIVDLRTMLTGKTQ